MINLKQANAMTKNTLMETLNITFTEINTNHIKATMPITDKVHQPMGYLHGGATIALAETVGSIASLIITDTNTHDIKGIEISTNHLKSKKTGIITATAKIIHRGKTTHLCQIKITDEDNNLIAICKQTNIILPKTNKNK